MGHAAIVQIFHEANAFSPQPATYADFASGRLYRGEAARTAIAASRNWAGGVAAGLEALGDEVSFGVCATARPGGVLDQASFRRLKQEMLDSLSAIAAEKPLSRTALLLHGALAVDGIEAPETEIARDVRRLIGANTPLLVTLDFHANVEPGLLDTADLVIAGKLYPHTDTFERGAELAALSTRPGRFSRCFRLPFVIPISAQSTDLPHMAEIVALCEALQQREGVDDISLLAGFPYADTDIVGASVLVTGTTLSAMAAAYRDLADAVWQRREALQQVPPVFADIADTVYAAAQSGPVVLADIGDNPGSGGIANQTHIIAELAQQPLPFVAGFVVDGAAVAEAGRMGVGARGPIAIGALRDGSPLVIDATIERVADVRYRNEGANMRGERMSGGMGAVLRVGTEGQGHICLVTERLQAFDTAAFSSQNIDLTSKAIIYLKSANHFRTAFTPLATGGVFLVDEGGCASTNIHHFTYRRRAKDVLPLTQLDAMQWQRLIDAESTAVLAHAPRRGD